jgi:FkbM family methyltransferase
VADFARADLIQVSDCRYGRMMYLKNDRYLGAALERFGEYSEGEIELWRQFIKPEWIVADIGANIGCHTVALARLASRGMVLACEPLRYTYYLLCGNIALNGLTHVQALNVAVGEKDGLLKVPSIDYTQEANYGGMALGAYEQGSQVPVIALDDVLPAVHFIKADVEGMEQQVLQGASRLIREYRPGLYVENNPGPKQQDLIDYIHELDYDLYWHTPHLFNPANYRHCLLDPEPGVVSYNMLALPAEQHVPVNGLEKIERRVKLAVV